MADFTYFTTALDGSRPIRIAERDELYSAFLQRADAVGYSYSLPTETTLSGIITDRVVGTQPRMLEALEAISVEYVRHAVLYGLPEVPDYTAALKYTVGDRSLSTNLINRAAALISASTAEAEAIIADPTLDTALRWNLTRAALKLLRYLPISTGSVGGYSKDASEVTWADTVTAFGGASEGSFDSGIGSTSFYTEGDTAPGLVSGEYVIVATRSQSGAIVPADLSGISYKLIALRRTVRQTVLGHLGTFVNAPLTYALSGSTSVAVASVPLTSGGNAAQAEYCTALLSTTGTKTIEYAYDAYTGSVAAFEPATDSYKDALTTIASFCAELSVTGNEAL